MTGIAPIAGVVPQAIWNLETKGISSFQSMGEVYLQELLLTAPSYLYFADSIDSVNKAVLVVAVIVLVVALLVLCGLTFMLLNKMNKKQKRHEQLMQDSKELTGLNKEKNHFISMVSHDIRSPLNSISGISDLLSMDAEKLTEAEIHEYANTIRSLVIRIRHLINNMMDASKIDEGSIRIELKPVDVSQILTEVEESLKIYAEKKEIEFKTEPAAGLPEVESDKDALYSVVENLVSNALKFSPSGTTVNVSAAQAGDQVKITVKDEGPGFTKADKEKLFTRFAKLSAKPTAKEKTTGLGLYIVHNLVQKMEGEIELESEKGKGATFSVFLNKA